MTFITDEDFSEHWARYEACKAQALATSCDRVPGLTIGECDCHGPLRRFLRTYARYPLGGELEAFTATDGKAERIRHRADSRIMRVWHRFRVARGPDPF